MFNGGLNFSVLLILRRKELQELQNLYSQNIEHTAQQAELIKQLQALNNGTQKVLKDQEDAHIAETTSYQKVMLFCFMITRFILMSICTIAMDRVIKLLYCLASFRSLDLDCCQNVVVKVTELIRLITSQHIYVPCLHCFDEP